MSMAGSKFNIHLESTNINNYLFFLKKDNYLVENLDVDIKKIPPYFEGDFKAEFQIVQDDQLLLGYNFYGTIIR